MSSEMYCFVGDLLGFRSIIRNLDGEERSKRVEDWLSLTQESAEKFELPSFQLVSDTIFAGAEATEDGLRRMLACAKHLLEEGMARHFPMRGAITFGDVAWDARIAFGGAIVEAYELEISQNWIGVSCAQRLPHIDNLLSFDSAVVYPAPMKAGPVALRPVISWNVPESEQLFKNAVGKGLVGEGQLLDWSWADKLQNTLIFALYMKVCKRMASQDKANPGQFYGIMPTQALEAFLSDAVSLD